MRIFFPTGKTRRRGGGRRERRQDENGPGRWALGRDLWEVRRNERTKKAQGPRPVKLTGPGCLCPEAKKLFRGYAKELLGSTLPVSRLDTGTLARLCDAEWSYAEASRHKNAFLAICSRILAQAADAEALQPAKMDQKKAYQQAQEYAAYWSKAMTGYEKIARGAANDLGCTISSRCRMVVPKAEKDDEDDPLERLRLLREGVV